MKDVEDAPYEARPAKSIRGIWMVYGNIGERYPTLIFQGTKHEAEAVSKALNDLADEIARNPE